MTNPTPLKVLVFGGRDYNNAAAVDAALDAIYLAYPDVCVIHGAARGSDTLAGLWAARHGLPEIRMPAQWNALGKSAGMERNAWMLKWAQPNYAIGFPGGVGTAGMARLVRAAKITLWLPHG